MASLAKRLSLILSASVLGTTFLGSVAYAAIPTADVTTLAAVPADTKRVATAGAIRPERERGDHHRRFCARLNVVLSRLVENGVITHEQKSRIMEAMICVPDDRPSTRRPTAVPTTATR